MSVSPEVRKSRAFAHIDGAIVAIAVLSIILSAALWYWAPIAFYPDSEQYVRSALAIINQPGQFYYYRTWGYPIVLILLHGLHSFEPVLVAQAALGAAIPVVIFATMRRFSRPMAIGVAIVSALSFAPYTWQKVIMTDQISMFLYYVLAYGAAQFIFDESNESLTFLGLISFLLYLMRPSATLLFFCTMACLLAFRWKAWRAIGIVSIAFVLTTQAVNLFESFVVNRYANQHAMDKTFITGSMTGKMFFYNVYAVGPFYTGGLTVDRSNGRCSENLYDELLEWGNKNPAGTNSYLRVKGGRAFANDLFADPNLYTHSIMWLAMDEQVGGTSADGTFACAAFEALKRHPNAALLFLNGFVQFFFSGDVVYNTGKLVTWDADGIATALITPYLTTDPSFPQNLLAELNDDKAHHQATLAESKSIFEGLFFWQTGIKFVATAIALVAFPACWFLGRRVACMANLLAVYLIYQGAVAVTFASPHFRYISPQIPLIVMLAGLGAMSVARLWPRIKALRVGTSQRQGS